MAQDIIINYVKHVAVYFYVFVVAIDLQAPEALRVTVNS